MNSKKWIFSTMCLVSSLAFASTTKVGNGDDGSDLEGVDRITSGIILETRREALEHLKALNIQGIQDLGQVLPELQHSELLMAKQDVHPISGEGEWDTSDDRQTVYARTFAEPHAPTRFFPAALKLTRAQLVALHTHEALHRALPAGVREDESRVAYLTMAITSPSATFDRVNRIAATTMHPNPEKKYFPMIGSSTAPALETERILPPPTKTDVHFEFLSFVGRYQPSSNMGKIGASGSPIGVYGLGSSSVEPIFSLDLFALGDRSANGFSVGPIGLAVRAPVTSGTSKVGPLLQMNLKALDDSYLSQTQTDSHQLPADRDVYTVGAFVENHSPNNENQVQLTYTLPGNVTGQSVDQVTNKVSWSHSRPIGGIWSLTAYDGVKFRQFTLGGGFEFHHCKGVDNDDPFTIVRAGPKLKWHWRRATLALSVIWTVNDAPQTLNSLGDLAGHGTGKETASASLEIAL